MMRVVSGGTNTASKNKPSELRTWVITTEDGETFRATGTDLFVGDSEESLVVFDKTVVVFSVKDHKNVILEGNQVERVPTAPRVSRPKKKA